MTGTKLQYFSDIIEELKNIIKTLTKGYVSERKATTDFGSR